MNASYDLAISLLKKLIATPSLSGEESKTADLIQDVLQSHGAATNRHINNVWARNKHFDPTKPTLLLNSHHDTVKPSDGYSRDPYTPQIIDDTLYGLGSNDAGGPLVSLIATFLHFHDQKDIPYNVLIAATAEEEISGANGISSILEKIAPVDCAIVGEPTRMRMAVAEKGLMVLECTATGKSGHAARNEGENAIYKALNDINWFRSYSFDKVSEFLGPIKMTVTVIHAGSQHNVVPDSCEFTVDVRTTDAYTNPGVLEIIKEHIESDINPRSVRLNPSSIPADHPLVQAGTAIGLESYGSPTVSDQACITAPSVKIGPGDSARSHTPDEYIKLGEIKDGIDTYIQLITQLMQS